jgi:hypothetical protein
MNRSIVLLALVLMGILGVSCDTTRHLYRSSASKKDYWTLRAFTLSHCGCTQLFADSYKNGNREFGIFYADNVARKWVYSFDKNNRIADTVVLIAKTGTDFQVPFDSLDTEIFNRIDAIITSNEGLVYPVKRTVYSGYSKDVLYNK